MSFWESISAPFSWFGEKVLEPLGEGVTAPTKWISDIVEKGGNIAGINEIENIGRTGHDIFVDPMVQKLAGATALAYAAPAALPSIAPEGGWSSLLGAEKAAEAGAGSMLPTGAASLGEFPLDVAGGVSSVSPEAWDALYAAGVTPPAGTATVATWPWDIEALSNAAGTAGTLAKGGVGKVASNSNMFPWLFGGGTLANTISNYLTGKRQEEASKDYLAASTWNDATRSKYLTGAKGELSNWLTGKAGADASNAASLGRGGGFYGNKLNQNLNKATEALASALAETYKPSTAPLAAYEGLKSPSLLESAMGGASSSILPAWLLSSFF